MQQLKGFIPKENEHLVEESIYLLKQALGHSYVKFDRVITFSDFVDVLNVLT